MRTLFCCQKLSARVADEPSAFVNDCTKDHAGLVPDGYSRPRALNQLARRDCDKGVFGRPEPPRVPRSASTARNEFGVAGAVGRAHKSVMEFCSPRDHVCLKTAGANLIYRCGQLECFKAALKSRLDNGTHRAARMREYRLANRWRWRVGMP